MAEQRRLTVAFATHSQDLLRRVVRPQARERLARCADVLADEVVSDFTSGRSRALLAQSDVLLTTWGCPRIDSRVLDAAPRLRLVAHAAGSVRGHVTPEVWGRGVIVTSAAQANARPVAEYTLAFILLAAKRVLPCAEVYARRQSLDAKELLTAETGNRGSTVGIVGASRTGRLVLDLLRPFDHEILLVDPFIGREEARALGAELVTLDALLVRSDVVSLHAPLLPTTRGMIGRDELAALRDGTTLINTARGGLVDHLALRAHLTSGRLHAVLDVTDPEPLPHGDPLYGLSNVVLTPHLAGSQGNEISRLGDLAVGEIERLAAGQDPAHPVVLADLDHGA